MFPYLRLARGYGVLDFTRWLLTVAASGTVAALLLRALGLALSTTGAIGPAVDRLLWCLPALAALGYLSAAWARSLPLQRPERMAGLVAAGAGPVRMRLLLAGEIALACALGTVLALLGFLVLRAHWLELTPGSGLDPDLGLGTGSSLPAAGTFTLIALVPLLGGVAAAAAVRSADLLPGDDADRVQRRPSTPLLVLALALPAAGTALELTGLHQGHGDAAVLTGWVIAVTGIAAAVPVLLYATGGLLAAGKPQIVRLLAGRGLQAESWRLGTPLAVLAITGAIGAVTAVRFADGHRPDGPLPLIEAGVLAVCVLGALLTRLAELVVARRTAYASLRRIGAHGGVFLRTTALRSTAAALVVLGAGAGAAALAAAALTNS